MSFWFWNGASSASALVDSALPGSQEDAWLSWTPVSLLAKRAPMSMAMTIHATATTHLVDRPVSFPAICRCMGPLQQIPPTVVIGVYPEFAGCCRIVTGVVEDAIK